MPLDQRQSHLPAGAGDRALKGGSRDRHTPRGLGLGQTLEIGQSQGLQLLVEQLDMAQPIQGHAGWLVDCRSGRQARVRRLRGLGTMG